MATILDISDVSLIWALGGIVLGVILARMFGGNKTREPNHLPQLRQEIKELEFEKKLLMRAQEMALLVIDSTDKVRLANEHAHEFLEHEKIEGLRYQEVLDNPIVLQEVEQAIRLGEPVKKQISAVVDSSEFKLGEERSIFLNITFLEGERASRFTQVSLHDNTEQVRTEQVRKDFIANASHELRTPLTIINGYVETLMEDVTLEDKEMSLHFLSIMKRHGQRLGHIIEEMLMISKLESGAQAVLNRAPFLLRECIDESLLQLDYLIKEKDTEIVIELSDPNVQLEGDKFYWNQVLFNLIENAIKQNPESPIRVEVSCDQCETSKLLTLAITDNGVGIPAPDLPYIFRRFYRVQKHHNQQKIKGTGLGLSIVKRAVEAHGGEIHCDSVQNKSTQFTITLPPSIRVA